jgi:hypothetical protein
MAGAGHVGFPRGLDLDLDLGDVVAGESGAGTGSGALASPRRVDDQVLDWLRRP